MSSGSRFAPTALLATPGIIQDQMASHHRVSDHLRDRWPILPEEREDGSKSISLAYADSSVPKLSALLLSNSLSTDQTTQCLALLESYCAAPEATVDAVRQDLIAVVLHAFKHPGADSAAVRLMCMAIICRTGHTCEGRQALLAASALDAIFATNHSDPAAPVRDRAAAALYILLSHADMQRHLCTGPPSHIVSLVNALPSTPLCVQAMAALCGSESRAIPRCLDAHAVTHVVSLVARGDLPAPLLHSATLTLRSLLADDRGKAHALDSDLLLHLPAALQTQDAETRLVVAGITTLLSIPPAGKARLLATPVSGSVALLLSDADPRIKHEATLAAINLSVLPAGRTAMLRLLLDKPEVCVRVFGHAMSSELVLALEDDSPPTVSNALRILAHMTETVADKEGCIRAMQASLHCEENLQALARGELPRVALAGAANAAECAAAAVAKQDVDAATRILAYLKL